MTAPPQTRAPARGLTAAAAVGSVVGLAIGAAYLGGTVAKATTVRVQAERIAGVRDAGYTEEALAAAAGGLNESALAIARRHDPYTVAGDAQRDRQAAQLAARLERLGPATRDRGLRQISFHAAPGSPARPFILGGALDDSRELDCLTQAGYYEARGEGRAGMQAVAQVVRLAVYKHLKEKDIPYEYRDHAWFTCFAPAVNPEIVVTVLVEHGLHGGSASAPIAAKILNRYFADKKAEQERKTDEPAGGGPAPPTVRWSAPLDPPEGVARWLRRGRSPRHHQQ